jgi:hypothetical protein
MKPTATHLLIAALLMLLALAVGSLAWIAHALAVKPVPPASSVNFPVMPRTEAKP